MDDLASGLVLARCGGAVPVVTYGIDNDTADVVAESATFSIWESELIVRTPAGRLQVCYGTCPPFMCDGSTAFLLLLAPRLFV